MLVTNEDARGRRLTGALAAYAGLVALLVAVSARLWWQSPLQLIQHEFDYFLGLFSSPDQALSATWVAIGRRLHLFAFVLVGGVYLFLVKQFARSPSLLSTRGVAIWAGIVAAVFAVGMPWVSPDVFFYIGTGWVESHYGFSPYLAGATNVPGFAQDQMFSNIYPGFLSGTTSYGPLFQKLAALIAGASGGDEKLALALCKAVGLVLHAGCSALVWRLAPAEFKRAALFSYAANPLICFSVLTCAHNDHWMNLFVLLALLAVSRRYWLLAGAALGAAFGIKYFPLVFLPVFALAAFVHGGGGGPWPRRAFDAVKVVVGFVGVVALGYLLYPEALKAFVAAAGSGIPVYRNCVYFFIDAFTAYALPILSGTQGFMVSHQGSLGGFLKGIYVACYSIMLLALTERLRRDPLRGIAEGCLAVTLLYFIFVNTGNQEWYLTWLMGPALILPYARACSLAWWLSAAFPPLIIFTINNPAPIWLIANALLYTLVLVLGARYLASLTSAIRDPSGWTEPVRQS